MEVIVNDFKCKYLAEEAMPPNFLMVLSESRI